MRNLIIILAILFLAMMLRNYLLRNPAKAPQLLKNGVITAVIIGLLLLTLLGKLPWLFALLAALIPALMRLLPLLKFLPFIKRFINKMQGPDAYQGPAQSSQRSTVQSAYFNMSLDHDSGEMDGEILQGRFKGRLLHQLKMTQLLQLLEECASDQDSFALLQAYLDRVHEGWRDQYQQSQEPGEYSTKMSETEACEILGVEPGASKEQIIAAHKRLMQKLHPDRGGSTYLATKVNLAKEYLLNH